jgi:hypothetical protein
VIELPLVDEAIAYGKRIKRENDARGIVGHFEHTNKRWIGFAAEYLIAGWLREHEIPHVWNGGVDDKPDFVIAEQIGVACKANVGDGPRDDFVFVIPEQQINRLADGVLFNIVALRERKLWIAGYITSWQFRRFAEKHKKGDPGFIEGRPIVNHCRTISASELAPAELFFDLIEKAVA